MNERFLGLLVAAAVTAATLPVAHGIDVQQKPNEQGGQAVAPTNAPLSAKELYAMVKKPTTPIELLKNIKFAIDHELLLRDDFYTDESLMRFLGGSQVKWVVNQPKHRQGSVSNLGELFEKSGANPYMEIGVFFSTVDENWRYVENGKLYGNITVAPAGDSRFTVETVETVLGDPTKVFYPYANDNPYHPTPLGPKTHPLGHMAFTYKFDHGASMGNITFVFGGSGTVLRLNASLVEVK